MSLAWFNQDAGCLPGSGVSPSTTCVITSSGEAAGEIVNKQRATNFNSDVVHNLSDRHSLGKYLRIVHCAAAIADQGWVDVKMKGTIKFEG
jgi:hypothetical protein